MPSKTPKQAKFMRAVANSPKFAKKVGVAQSVGKEYEMADKKTKKFGSGAKRRYATGDRVTSADVTAGDAPSTPITVADITPATPSVRANRDDMSFGAAFRAARNAGDRTFTWRGREYTTQTREEAAPRRRSRPTPTPTPTPAPARTRTAATPAPAPARTRAADIPRSTRNAQSDAQLARALRGASGSSRTPADAMALRDRLQRRSMENRNAKGGSIDGIAKRGKTRASTKNRRK